MIAKQKGYADVLQVLNDANLTRANKRVRRD
jgi:hypothetical protein